MTKQFNYFLINFQLFYDISDIEVSYGKTSINNKITITQSVQESFWKAKNDIASKEIVWKVWKNKRIPFLFEKKQDKEIISIKDNRTIINYDIVASAFYFLSGWNEYVNPKKDEYSRTKYNGSIIQELNITDTPIVNYYFDILAEAVKKSCDREIKRNIWGVNKFAVTLTHDVDSCMSAWLEGSYSELRKKRLRSIPKLLINRLLGKDDWFNFKEIMDIEEKFQAKSTFFFLPQKGKIHKWKNADYNISDKRIQEAISSIENRKHEVGVHGSFGTHYNTEKFNEDIQRVNSNTVEGARFHFLMFDIEKTANTLESCSIKYDTTLGFAEHIGFRRSTCYPFFLWNFDKDSISSVLEIPLIVMDGSLASTKYMGLSKAESTSKVLNLIDEIERFNGVFTILWHNTFFSEYKYTGWKSVYCEILNYCNTKNGLLTTGIDIYNKVQ